MDDTDRAVREELERRLAVIGVEERETPRPPFPRGDMVVLVVIAVLAVVVGLVVGLG
jgi:hypothetical protein